MVLTNVPGPRSPLVYKGKRVTGFMALVPGMGKLACGISAISMHNSIVIGVQAERNVIGDSRQVRDLFEKNYDQLVNELQ
jgi:hypothetical protein